jgi:O-antigen/teichoic acid export membrane protein
MDTILLAFWKGDQEVGIYQAVFKIILLTFVILDVAISALMPALSRFHSEGSERWNQVGYLLYKTLVLVALPIMMILFVYADQVIGILYGKDKFVEAIPILRVFSMIGFVRFAAEPFGLMLTTGHRQTRRMIISVVAALLNFSLNAYFIPKEGPMGAAQVSLVTNILVALAYLAVTKPFLGFWVIDFATLVPLGLTIILSVILWQVRSIPLWYVGLPSAALCLLIGYWIGYTPNERRTLFTLKIGLTTPW